MPALIVAILCTTSFSLIIRHTQRLGYDQFAVMGINYLTACVMGLAMAGGAGQASPPTLHIGLLGGAAFVTTYILILHSFDLKGVAVANAITRLSVLIPVLATILVWHERPQVTEGLGALLALGAMPMLTLDRDGNGKTLTPKQIPLLLGLFVGNGTCLLMSKWFHETGLSGERPLFFAILFGTAAAVSLVCWLIWSRRSGWREWAWGVPLGAINFLTALAVITALDTLSGSVVFPLFAAVSLALTTGVGAWLWREIPGKLGRVGIAVALVAVVLINWKA